MITETGTTTLADTRSAVSWKAILAGTVAAAAISLMMVAFGVGVGFSVVSPWADHGLSSTTFTIAAGVYLIVLAMIPSTIGGYIAGRLRAQWQTVHAHERYFRDSAHGFLVWALATIVIAAFLGGAITHLLSGAASGLTSAAGAAGASAGASAPTDVYVDRLLRTGAPQASAAAAAPAGQTPAAAAASTPSQPDANAAPQGAPSRDGNMRANRTEISRIIGPAMLKGGNVSDADKAYLSQVVAARTGLSQAQAQERVNQTMTQAKADADAARKSAAKFALWLVASMLAGALSASLAAIEGGSLRNTEWYVAAR
jgi:hypothetical protein